MHMFTDTVPEYNTSKISIVTVSVDGSPSIDECLRALERQQGNTDAEIIVVSCCKDSTAEYIRKNFPCVKLLQLSERLSIPELRATGMSYATGDIIVITEDCCIAQENWFQEIIKAHELGYGAVGGAIENESADRIVNWAAYLCEYSHSMLPIPHGEVDGIAGNNASYRREALNKVNEFVKKNCWEFFLHEELKKLGVKFLSMPTIVVSKKKEFGFLYFLTQRFHYSRSFADMRRRRVSLPKRILYVFFSPFLPLLMMWRITQEVFRKRRRRKEFLLSLPLMTVFLLSYALGEFIGYLLGPGKSLVKVE